MLSCSIRRPHTSAAAEGGAAAARSGAGWAEFDPTNGIVGNRDLIRVAVARQASQAVPLAGTWTGFPADSLGMDVEVHVTSAEPGAADGAAPAAPAAAERAAAPSPAASDAALV